jgi:hypothetical protein
MGQIPNRNLDVSVWRLAMPKPKFWDGSTTNQNQHGNSFQPLCLGLAHAGAKTIDLSLSWQRYVQFKATISR